VKEGGGCRNFASPKCCTSILLRSCKGSAAQHRARTAAQLHQPPGIATLPPHLPGKPPARDNAKPELLASHLSGFNSGFDCLGGLGWVFNLFLKSRLKKTSQIQSPACWSQGELRRQKGNELSEV